MEKFENRLRELGIVLPSLPAPIANYVPAKRVGNLIFTAGQVSVVDGREYKGKLGSNLSLDDAQAATKACAINCLAAIKSVTGSLDNIKQVVAVHGLVNSTSDCEDQAKAMNEDASDFMVDVFGEAGKHTRTAVGVSLPMGFAASVYMIVEVE